MDTRTFRDFGRAMIEYVIEYRDTIEKRRVLSNVQPGYLEPLIPDRAPPKPEDWREIMDDIERIIMPGMTHWLHPHFHAYFATAATYPGIVADILIGGLGGMGFSWATSPVMTELETICLDWIAKAINLPKQFLFKESGGVGGGALQTSASEAILVAMLAARRQALEHIKQNENLPSDTHEGFLLPRLVIYTSAEAHSSVEKNAMICLVDVRVIDTDQKTHRMIPGKLKEAMEKDKANGLHPCFVLATLGTTGTAAFDSIKDIGPIVKKFPACWFHADCAYGGGSFICPELREPMIGMELLDSVNFNPYKWMQINFDVSCLFTSSIYKLTRGMVVHPVYLKHDNEGKTLDLRHWGIPLSRRFRALKIWFTMRMLGIEAIQKYVRNHVQLTKEFEKLIRQDKRFEVVNLVQASLVAFRLKGEDDLTTNLLAKINYAGKIHMVPTKVHSKYAIRFVVTAENAKMDDITFAWEEIKRQTEAVFADVKTGQINSPANRQLVKQFSFTRSISREQYQRESRSSLYDSALPIFLVGEDEHEDEDDVFNQL